MLEFRIKVVEENTTKRNNNNNEVFHNLYHFTFFHNFINMENNVMKAIPYTM